MVDMIDELILGQDQLLAFTLSDHKQCKPGISVTRHLADTNHLLTNQEHNYQETRLGIEAHLHHHGSRDAVNRDACIPNKVIGVLNHQSLL